MATQLFDDGSLTISENSKNDSNKLKLITESLEKLTEPQKINDMAEELQKRGILTDKDIEKLKADGIIKEQFPNLEIQQDQEKVNKSNSNPMIEEYENDDDMEMEL